VLVRATKENGLLRDSYVMTDKIVTVDKKMLGERVGTLSSNEMKKISKQLIIILGLGK